MMEGLRQWLLGIVLTAFAAGLARQLAPDGREQAAVRLVGGLLLVLAILRPLGSWDWEGLSLEAGSFRQETLRQTEKYEEEQMAALSAIIAEKTSAYIWDKAGRLGLSCTVEVTVSAGEVGIPAGKQIWLEENVWSGKKESG